MSRCEAELCRNWTGQGCACEFLGLEPDEVDEEQKAQIRATREARREAEWAKRDAEYAERGRLDERVDQAAAAAFATLPGGIGTALAAVLYAMRPFRASDGHMSFAAIGRSSPEVLALAEAILSEAAAQPPAPITAEDVDAALDAWLEVRDDEGLHRSKAAFVADYLNRRGER